MHIFQLEENASRAMCQNNLTLSRTIDLHVIMLHVCTLKLGHLPITRSKYFSHVMTKRQNCFILKLGGITLDNWLQGKKGAVFFLEPL